MCDFVFRDSTDIHIYDIGVRGDSLKPGVPLLVYMGAYYVLDNGHFGAGLTPLPDSSALVDTHHEPPGCRGLPQGWRRLSRWHGSSRLESGAPAWSPSGVNPLPTAQSKVSTGSPLPPPVGSNVTSARESDDPTNAESATIAARNFVLVDTKPFGLRFGTGSSNMHLPSSVLRRILRRHD